MAARDGDGDPEIATRWDALYRARSVSSPVNDTLGFVPDALDDPAAGVSFTWTVPAAYCNSAGNLQGGILAAFADALLGGALSAHLPPDRYPALAEMKISILRPAPAGATIVGTAAVLKRGRRVSFVEAEIVGEDGKLIAKASGTEIEVPAPD
ncbi:MAG: PaaI family thioesterase [Actinomycetota bacterium]|nr:PaaI family thioesterase [Actinomycetota bacterium]